MNEVEIIACSGPQELIQALLLRMEVVGPMLQVARVLELDVTLALMMR